MALVVLLRHQPTSSVPQAIIALREVKHPWDVKRDHIKTIEVMQRARYALLVTSALLTLLYRKNAHLNTTAQQEQG
jgi:hypothetical protein